MCQVYSGGRLSYPAFLVADGDDLGRHYEPPWGNGVISFSSIK